MGSKATMSKSIIGGSYEASGVVGEGMDLLNRWQRMSSMSDPGQSFAGEKKGGVREGQQFPGRYIPIDPRDHRAEIRGEILKGGKGLLYGQVTEEDISAVERKEAATALAGFEEWFQKSFQFDSTNPTLQGWAQRMRPQYFDRRVKVIQDIAQLQSRLALLKLHGPQSPEDLEFLYLVSTGKIEIPDKPLQDITGHDYDKSRNQGRGFFNPLRREINSSQSSAFENLTGTKFVFGNAGSGSSEREFSKQSAAAAGYF